MKNAWPQVFMSLLKKVFFTNLFFILPQFCHSKTENSIRSSTPQEKVFRLVKYLFDIQLIRCIHWLSNIIFRTDYLRPHFVFAMNSFTSHAVKRNLPYFSNSLLFHYYFYIINFWYSRRTKIHFLLNWFFNLIHSMLRLYCFPFLFTRFYLYFNLFYYTLYLIIYLLFVPKKKPFTDNCSYSNT